MRRAKRRRANNPHLTGKWQYVGHFDTYDIGPARSMLKVHGIGCKVTHDVQTKNRMLRELYVQRGKLDMAMRLISALYERSNAALRRG